MKPFNLKEALEGKYCVTRDGCKVKLLLDKRTLKEYKSDNPYHILGVYQCEDNTWSLVAVWTVEGRIATDIESELDIVGMWEEPQPKITIDIPAPLKVAEEGQVVWSFGYNSTGYLLHLEDDIVQELTFQTRIYFHQYLLETGQLFKTKEDCLEFLSVLKGARQ